MDQSSFAAPQDLSQRTTSFIASQRQGIHQMLLRHLITLMIDVRSAKTGHDPKERPVLGFLQKHIFACQAYPAPLAAGQGWFAGLGCPLAEYAASLRFQTSALTLNEGRRIALTSGHIKKWWSLSGSNRRPEACKATALPAELRPLFCLASVAGRDVRPFGYPRHGARRPVGLRKKVVQGRRDSVASPTGRPR